MQRICQNLAQSMRTSCFEFVSKRLIISVYGTNLFLCHKTGYFWLFLILFNFCNRCTISPRHFTSLCHNQDYTKAFMTLIELSRIIHTFFNKSSSGDVMPSSMYLQDILMPICAFKHLQLDEMRLC